MSDLIFVTTGTQLPFQRLVNSVDAWAERNKESEIVAQTSGGEKPKNFVAYPFFEPAKYLDVVRNARLIVSHAGIGSIITAHEYSLPIIIMPRRFDLGEHRNDHQLATVRKFKSTEGVYAAENEEQLFELLDAQDLFPCKNEGNTNRNSFIFELKKIIEK